MAGGLGPDPDRRPGHRGTGAAHAANASATCVGLAPGAELPSPTRHAMPRRRDSVGLVCSAAGRLDPRPGGRGAPVGVTVTPSLGVTATAGRPGGPAGPPGAAQ
eukprot:698617-Hanusia_phi.AAC.7